MDLSTVSTQDLECELRDREWKRKDEIRAAGGYHVRMQVCELTRKLEKDRILKGYQAIKIDKASFWLEYHEFANVTGGVVIGLNCMIDEEVYLKNHLEALVCDIEIGKWIKLLS